MAEEYERYKRAQAAKWLEHVRGLSIRADKLKAEVDMQRGMMDGVKGVSYDGGGGGASSDDAVLRAVARLQSAISRYAVELASLVDEQEEAHAALAKLDRAEHEAALTKHYVLGETWEKACVDMGYTWDGMMSLRRQALSAAYDVMPPRWRDPLHPAL